ncbi:lytic transglycosylase [Edwardsiella tarda]|nr:lytic transglycosylase [Edwardsiella tarda]
MTANKSRNYILAMLIFSFSCTVSADCFEQAGQDSHIDPDLLRAIAKVESNHDPLAIGKNPRQGFGVGIMQIDSQHFRYLERFGIYPELLLDKCINIYTGAYFLKLALNRMGNSWEAVGAYNAGFSKKRQQSERRQRYAERVRKHYNLIKRSEQNQAI